MQNWTTTKILLDSNKNELKQFLFKEYSVDTSGNIIDETEYDSKSNIICKRIYRYFDSGEIKEYIEFDPFEELLERHSYTKNEFGEINKIEFEFSEGQKSIKEISFTDIGNAEKATIRNENGNITGFEVFTIDKNGRIIEEIELDSDNIEISKYEKEYNENGTLKFEKNYRNERLYSKEIFEYDTNNNLIKKQLEILPENIKVIDIYRFDNKNNMIYNSSHQNGVFVFENKCEYDNDNNLISEEFFELDYWEKSIVVNERLLHKIKD